MINRHEKIRAEFQITPLIKENGFTLIELLVVVLIIGVLATIALPQYQKAVEKTKFTERIVWFRQIYRAEKMYYMNAGSYDHSLAKLEIQWPRGTRLTPNAARFGSITLPNGLYFSINSNNGTIQTSYKGVTLQNSLSTGDVACYHYADNAKKKICQNIQHPGYGCYINYCTIISFGK